MGEVTRQKRICGKLLPEAFEESLKNNSQLHKKSKTPKSQKPADMNDEIIPF